MDKILKFNDYRDWESIAIDFLNTVENPIISESESNDDNFKNILQVRIQKEFKVTPDYLEIEQHNIETGYYMGVYLCLGQSIHDLKPEDALPLSRFKTFQDIHQYMSTNGRVFICFSEGRHKTKKKAEQIACDLAINLLKDF
jgi:hypothetical protein